MKLWSLAGTIFALLATAGCADAASRDICGNPKVRQTLAAILLEEGTPENFGGSAYKALNIIILQQQSDETGLRVYCTASINVTQPALDGYYAKLSERDAKATKFAEMMGGKGTKSAAVHFLVTLESNGALSQIALRDADTVNETVRSVRWWLTNVVTGRT